jgi:hypothetical protein
MQIYANFTTEITQVFVYTAYYHDKNDRMQSYLAFAASIRAMTL